MKRRSMFAHWANSERKETKRKITKTQHIVLSVAFLFILNIKLGEFASVTDQSAI